VAGGECGFIAGTRDIAVLGGSAEGSGAICGGSGGASQAAEPCDESGLGSEVVFRSAGQNLWESLQSPGNVWRPFCSLAKHRGVGVNLCARAASYLIAESRTCLGSARAQRVH